VADDDVDREEIAKRALEIAARAEELARNAHESANIEEQLGQLEAELASLDAEEARLTYDADAPDQPGAEAEADADPAPRWATHLTDRMGSLGERIGSFIEQVTESAMQSLDTTLDLALGSRADDQVETQTVAVTGPADVQVTSHAGAVRVAAHDDNAVVVTAAGRRTSTAEPLVDVQQDGDSVRITTPRPRHSHTRGVRIHVLVPRGTGLTLGTGGGSVHVDGVHGQVAVRTGGGSIAVSGARGAATFTTGGGSIEVTDVDATVTARTGAGSITVDGCLTGASSLMTGGGSIVVRLAQPAAISVAARGTSAYTDVDGLMAHNGRISGQVGDGSNGHLDAKTGGGSVRIVR
jgi:hypothetical protein